MKPTLILATILLACSAQARPQLACVGDSITIGAPGRAEDSYCNRVAERLGATALNLGVSGMTSRWWVSRASPEIPKADLTLLMIGTNDWRLQCGSSQEYGWNVLTIIDRIPRGPVVLLVPLFGRVGYAEATYRIGMLLPRRVVVVEVQSLLTEPGDLGPLLHPTPQGHQKIKKAVLQAIRERGLRDRKGRRW